MNNIEALKALADESRLRIAHLLVQNELNVQELTSILNISQSTVSHHLKTLQSAHVLTQRKEGTWVYYSLTNGEDASPGNLAREIIKLIKAKESEPFVSDSHQLHDALDRRRDKTRHFFDSVARGWRSIREQAHGNISYMDEIVSRIPPEAALLELGCGSGALLEKIPARNATIIGVDSSQVMLDEAQKLVSKSSKKIDLRLGYLEHLPVADSSIDMAFAYMVFHHIAEPKKALIDISRVLKPGSSLVIVDFTQSSDEIMQERFGELWHSFSPQAFSSWVKQAGFSEVSLKPLGKHEAFLLEAIK